MFELRPRNTERDKKRDIYDTTWQIKDESNSK